MLSALSFLLVFCVAWSQKLTKEYIRKRFNKLIDFAICLFFIFSGISLLVAQEIYNSVSFRILTIGILVYYIGQLYIPSLTQKRIFIHVLGMTTVFIALLSILQLLFPGVMNAIAYSYLSGIDAYGLIYDFQRGRLLHWGVIIFSFPFFYASALTIKKRNIFSYIYIIGGFFLLAAAMIITNFRWTLICFGVVTMVFGRVAISYNYIRLKTVFYLIMLLIFAAVSGLIAAKLVLNYNVVDRFFLVDAQRDVEETFGRVFLYKQAFDLYLQAPLMGVGMGNYRFLVDPFELHRYFSIFDQWARLPEPIASHNELLTILAESGIGGLISFLLIVYLTIKKLGQYVFRYYHTLTKTDLLFLLALFSSYLSFILYSLFENIYPHNYIYLLLVSGITYAWFPEPSKKT